MKKLLCTMLCLCLLSGTFTCYAQSTATQPDKTLAAPEFTRTPQEFVSGIIAGWNLGNTFEATKPWNWKESRNPTAYEEETGWGNPYTTKAMIDKVAEAGFNAVRLPVSWYVQTEKNGSTYTIKSDWMNRVKEVAGYCLDNDMYTIVDIHHDDKDWLDISQTGDKWTAILDEYKQLWTQIATEFKDYGELLILESNNEIVNGGDWWGTDADFEKINELYQVFVNTVRSTGGNNDKRYLMIPTYGAQWYSHQVDPIVVPNDDEHMIIDVHWYTDSYGDTAKMNSNFNTLKNAAERKGVPIVLGECSIRKKYDDDAKVKWANNYVGLARTYGLKCFLWDDGGDYQILQRKANPLSWVSESFVKAVLSSAGYVLIGDVNNDGYVRPSDTYSLKRYLARYTDSMTIDKTNADTNKDGVINVKDVMYLKLYLARKISKL